MKLPFKQTRIDIKQYAEKLSHDGFKQIFDHIDQFNIKKGVDKMGLDKFINHVPTWLRARGLYRGVAVP